MTFTLRTCWRLASPGGLLADEWSVLTNVLQCLTVADKWLVPSSVYGCRHCTWTSTGWTQKVTPPLRPLLIFQPWVQIFAWNFTWLSNNQIYTLSPSFVEYIGKWQNYAVSAKTTPFLSVRASCRTDWMRTGSLRRLEWPSSSTDLNPLDCHI